ncbi:MAG: hypothetical protein ABFS19_13565 [Thermodesulfobacteriota bacterium]
MTDKDETINRDELTTKGHSSHTNEQESSAVLEAKAGPGLLVDTLLKKPDLLVRQIVDGRSARNIAVLVLAGACCHLAYGLIVGSFSGNSQWLAAPLKIIFGTTLSALLCFPSLYIFASLSGASLTPGQALGLMSSGLSLVGVLLLGFAPVAFVFTFSIQTSFFMGAIHLLIWGVGIIFGLRYILKSLAAMSCRDGYLIKLWGVILVVTMLQMSTTLRPIIGESDKLLTTEKRSFVVHWLENGSDMEKEQVR